MSIEEKIIDITGKLELLKKLDPKRKLFGASSHKYQLNNPADEKEIKVFEVEHQIQLPDEYRVFLKKLGNGGAGPYYGLQTLQDTIFDDLDYKVAGEYLNPTIPFPHTEAWNMKYSGSEDDEEAYEEFCDEYFQAKWATGLLKICNFGCGVAMCLVVNGPEKGNICVDDRSNDGGIYPDPYFNQVTKTGFLTWYSLWLDNSISELKKGKSI